MNTIKVEICCGTACYLLGLEVGSSEYNKIISSVLRDTSIDSKDFIAAAKAYAKK